MSKIPTAEEFLRNKLISTPLKGKEAVQDWWTVSEWMVELTKLHLQAQREAIEKNIEIDQNGCCSDVEFECSAVIDKQSIKDAYPDENVK